MTTATLAQLAAEVQAARERIGGTVLRTPVLASDPLSAALGAPVFLKLENVQLTGSFKVRGACNRLMTLSKDQLARGVVAASSGNHGLGVAWSARRLGSAALVFVPDSTPAEKRAAIAALGAEVTAFGADCVDTEAHARAVAAFSGRTYVSPYNDLLVAAGQGTIGLELLEQVEDLEAVYVALGGGGLIAGIGAAIKAQRPGVELVAVSPEASPAMDECVRQGRIVEVPCGPTLSDSTAGGVEADAVTFPLCRDLVDRYLRVSEADIEAALRWCMARQHLLVEGAAALAVAGCALDRGRRPGSVAVVVCGGNIPWTTLRRVLAEAGDRGPELPGSRA